MLTAAPLDNPRSFAHDVTPADGPCCRRCAAAPCSRACSAASWPHRCARAAPAPPADRRRHRAGAWRSCGGARAGASVGATVGRRSGGRRVASGAGRARWRTAPTRPRPNPGPTSWRIASHDRRRTDRRLRQRDPSLLAPLAPDDDSPGLEVDRRDVEPAQLADSQPRAVQHLEDGVVHRAPPHRFVLGSRTLQQLADVVRVEHSRQVGHRQPGCARPPWDRW